jgi:hypothetical protein
MAIRYKSIFDQGRFVTKKGWYYERTIGVLAQLVWTSLTNQTKPIVLQKAWLHVKMNIELICPALRCNTEEEVFYQRLSEIAGVQKIAKFCGTIRISLTDQYEKAPWHK